MTSPNLPPFSYAQAARGQSASKTSSQAPSHITSKPNATPGSNPTTTSRGRKSTSTGMVKGELSSRIADAATDESSRLPTAKRQGEDGRERSNTSGSLHRETVPSGKRSGSSGDETKVTTSGTSSPSFGVESTSTFPKEDISLTPNECSEAWDKQSQVSTSAEKSTQTTNENKVNDEEDDWEKISVPKIEAEKELKAAPLPTVNIWQQRKEAAQAKVKAHAATAPVKPGIVMTKSKTVSGDIPDAKIIVSDELRRRSSGKSLATPGRNEVHTKPKNGEIAKTREDGDCFSTYPT